VRLTVLASGSSGNVALVESGGRAILLDAGISARETLRRLTMAGGADARIQAILVTHEHVDHVRGVRVVARKLRVPVYGTAGTLQAIASSLADVPETVTIDRRDRFSLAGMKITAFPSSHDAADPCGYSFESRRGHRVVITTDTGVITAEAAEVLAGAHVIGIEANHDRTMLDTGPYPPFLKRRIAGGTGHLSNDAAADALKAVAWRGLSQVFAMHISEQNNSPEVAQAALARTLRSQSQVALEIVCRDQIAGCSL
jgi:phosphoribosyl 1,2-cyclic phosphodiesterase